VTALQKRLREHGISAADLPRINISPSTIAVQQVRAGVRVQPGRGIPT
jgi:hypothetical protein